ncbi:MAG: lysozyme [Vibrio litoralis]|uniref:lysozyme n=1 Tax=Vibrio litoralis TaxID=335972 RepID=UPI003F9487FC
MQISKRVMAAISAAALSIASAMIVDLEGVEYTPYYDVAGVLTVCYGHTGDDIEDRTYSEEECQELLDSDLTRIASLIDPNIYADISVTQRAALYSFTYNVGPTAFNNSTLLKKLNANDMAGACSELHRWIYAGGKKWKGLMNRREIEEAVCLYGQ